MGKAIFCIVLPIIHKLTMPIVKPFCALKPATPLLADVVIRPLENYCPEDVKAIALKHPHSFLHLINPALENPFLRGTKQELIYKKINENLESFIEQRVLERYEKPGLYLYRVIHDGLTQTGIWTLTHVDDYLTGKIKKHESTVQEREKLLAEYLQQTGIDANPVLITYTPHQAIESITERYMALAPDLDFAMQGSRHQVWPIDDETDLAVLTDAFASIPYVYIADGHHRIASMAKMAMHKRALNGDKHNGTELYNYLTTVYMNTQQVKVLEFNRLVRDLGALTKEEFLANLSHSFDVELASTPVMPAELHTLGMYLSKQWYILKPKNKLYDEVDPVNLLDVSLLQKFILSPILQIGNPRTDARISFEGGRTPIAALQEKVDSGAYALAFTLFPVSIAQVVAVADAQGVMPPKSTWVEPKFLTGLLTNYFN